MALEATVLADWFEMTFQICFGLALIGLEGEAGLKRFIGWQQQVSQHWKLNPLISLLYISTVA